jgi:hypothetical protein
MINDQIIYLISGNMLYSLDLTKTMCMVAMSVTVNTHVIK